MEQKYKKRMMPESVFFLSCENEKGEKWYDISFNGAGFPKIEEVQRMQIALSNLLEKMGKLGQKEIDKINKEIENNRVKEMMDIGNSIRNKEKKQEKITGYVYLIKCKNYYKIGRAKDFKSRIKTYKTENPFETNVIFQKEVKDYIGVEQKLLNNFNHKKIGGEWFALNKNDVEWIKLNT